jgi:hypothetical protein
MYPKLKINVYFIFLNIGDLTFGITFVYSVASSITVFKLNVLLLLMQFPVSELIEISRNYS